jgi:DNA invertase Pin-like site-specific DNA recombinase
MIVLHSLWLGPPPPPKKKAKAAMTAPTTPARSLTDLLDFLRELHAKGVDLFLHQQGLDTSTPSGRAMFQMMGVFAEFERAMIRERVLAGLARAKEQGINLGRRRLEDSDAAKVAAIKRALAAKRGVRRIARDLETGVGTVLRIKSELAA